MIQSRASSASTGQSCLYLTIRLFTEYHVGSVWHSGHVAAGPFILAISDRRDLADHLRALRRRLLALPAPRHRGGERAEPLRHVHVRDTTLTALRPLEVRRGVRLVFVVASAVVGTVIAIAATSNFLANFQNFILFLAYFLIPWTAINLVDFYLLRKERYDIASIFRPDGIYGRFNVRAVAAYVIGVLVEIPFMSTTFYTGPMVSHLGGADISWILGLVVASGLHYGLMRPVVKRTG